MPRYILLMNWTDDGAASFDGLLERAKDARAAIKEFGGRWVGEHYTLGAYDLVATVEAPTDNDVAAFALALGARGDLRTVTLPAFERKDMEAILDSAKLHGGKLHGGKLHGGKLHGGEAAGG